jgi:hypothetical protein
MNREEHRLALKITHQVEAQLRQYLGADISDDELVEHWKERPLEEQDAVLRLCGPVPKPLFGIRKQGGRR